MALVEEGKILVSKHYQKGEFFDEEKIPVRKFETTPAKIKVGLGMTINLQNFESARVDVQVELPCYQEEVNEAIEEAKNLASKKVKQYIIEVKKKRGL